jgi:hypothetical protein
VLAAYAACGAQIAFSDDACGRQSSITVPVLSGDSYKIRVSGFNTMGTGGHLDSPACSASDYCRRHPRRQRTFHYTTIGATIDIPRHLRSAESPDVWFRYRVLFGAPRRRRHLRAHRTIPCFGLPPATGLARLRRHFCGQQTLRLPGHAGQQYLVRVSGKHNRAGSGQSAFLAACDWSISGCSTARTLRLPHRVLHGNADFNRSGRPAARTSSTS